MRHSVLASLLVTSWYFLAAPTQAHSEEAQVTSAEGGCAIHYVTDRTSPPEGAHVVADESMECRDGFLHGRGDANLSRSSGEVVATWSGAFSRGYFTRDVVWEAPFGPRFTGADGSDVLAVNIGGDPGLAADFYTHLIRLDANEWAWCDDYRRDPRVFVHDQQATDETFTLGRARSLVETAATIASFECPQAERFRVTIGPDPIVDQAAAQEAFFETTARLEDGRWIIDEEDPTTVHHANAREQERQQLLACQTTPQDEALQCPAESLLGCLDQTLRRSVSLAGVPLELVYSSARTPGGSPHAAWDARRYGLGGWTLEGHHAYDPDSRVLLRAEGIVRKAEPIDELATGETVAVVSSDGAELYVFDNKGNHLQTRNTLTGVTTLSFAYGSTGLLESVRGPAGEGIHVERLSDGQPRAIIGSGGHVSSLTLDENGFLRLIAGATGAAEKFESCSNGLLLAHDDPLGGRTKFAFADSGRLTRVERSSRERHAHRASRG